jgi:hypothetical protein
MAVRLYWLAADLPYSTTSSGTLTRQPRSPVPGPAEALCLSVIRPSIRFDGLILIVYFSSFTTKHLRADPEEYNEVLNPPQWRGRRRREEPRLADPRLALEADGGQSRARVLDLHTRGGAGPRASTAAGRAGREPPRRSPGSGPSRGPDRGSSWRSWRLPVVLRPRPSPRLPEAILGASLDDPDT